MVVGAALLAFVCSLTITTTALAADELAWAPMSHLAGPGERYGFDKVESLSCPHAGGECTALGRYATAQEVFAPFVAGELAGAWDAGTPLPGIGQKVELQRISCSGTGECGAIGEEGPPPWGVVDEESHGVWGATREVGLPPNAEAGDSFLSAISCPSAGTCVAIGEYTGPYRPNSRASMIVEESGGVWKQARQVMPPANASAPSMTMRSVSCSAPGWCAVVGTFSSSREEAFVLDEVDGVWQEAEDLPPGMSAWDNAELTQVSCTGPRECSAIGRYGVSGSNGVEGLAARESGGVWTATPLRPPPDAAEVGAVELHSLSCAEPGWCAAVGVYAARGAQGERVPRAAVVDQRGGAWGPVEAAVLPAADADATRGGGLESVSCYAAGGCTAVGYYRTGEYRTGEKTTGMIASETNGAWTSVSATPPPGETLGYAPPLLFVSCTVTPSCVASGASPGSSGDSETEVTSAQPATPSTDAAGLTDGGSAGPPSSAPFSSQLSPRATQVETAAVAVDSTTAVVAHGHVRVQLSCRAARCSGRLTLSATRAQTTALGETIVARSRPVLLAAGGFSIVGSARRTIALAMTGAGRRLLRHATERHPVRGLVLTIDVRGLPAARLAIRVR